MTLVIFRVLVHFELSNLSLTCTQIIATTDFVSWQLLLCELADSTIECFQFNATKDILKICENMKD